MEVRAKKEALNVLLYRTGHTKSSFSKEIGKSINYTIQICNGTRSPGPELAKKILEVLDADFDSVFEFVEKGQGKRNLITPPNLNLAHTAF